MKTFSAKANEVPRKWWIIDANNQVLGRVAVKAANLLRGKEKAIYTPHVDTGDFVVVINAEKVRLTGKKEDQKTYMSFSGFVGGHKTENVKARRVRHPELMVERAIRGMIPHNRLGRAVYRKLKVYKGDVHPHAAQQPAPSHSPNAEPIFHGQLLRNLSPPDAARLLSPASAWRPATARSTSTARRLKNISRRSRCRTPSCSRCRP